ncbi:hypothetical protein C0J52_16025, partial [Blattella germanica]
SPDHSVCNYFLWGYLKSRVYIEKPQILEVLAEVITWKVREISLSILETVERRMDNLSSRLQQCLDKNRCHLDVIFRT